MREGYLKSAARSSCEEACRQAAFGQFLMMQYEIEDVAMRNVVPSTGEFYLAVSLDSKTSSDYY